jgi:exodeoxyribonuclease V alpha subunit
MACALAARSQFAVITGGPGTGKTNTVIRLLGLLQASALDAGHPTLRIRLAAPTGKAAARLDEAIGGQIDQLRTLDLPGGEALHQAIPREVTTLHRLLGARPGTRHFRHHAGHPLPLDMVVVDEASMVDIEMMTALLDALPAHARLVLLGDRDQLASVEAGAVLGRLCAQAEGGHYQAETAQWLQAATGEAVDPSLRDDTGRPLDQAIAMLRHSFRFDAGGGIGQLARAINTGDAQAALHILKAQDHDDLDYRGLHGADDPTVARLVTSRPDYPMRPAADAERAEWDAWATAILETAGQFQMLTPLRRGPFGADRWYAGRPVMVTGNDYGLKLMNGDIGITLRVPARFGDPEQGEDLRVAFRSEGRVRWVLPSRLQRVETVYAMTVHKSQGSEFAHTALIVPDTAPPVLTRELIYTAVTRARERFTLLCASDRVLTQAIQRRVTRQSQLFS